MSEQVPERLVDDILHGQALSYDLAFRQREVCEQLSVECKANQDPAWKRPYRIAALLLAVGCIVFIAIGYGVQDTEFYGIAASCFFMAIIAYIAPGLVVRPGMRSAADFYKELSEEEVQKKRKETLKKDHLRLVWMIQARILAYNKVFDAIEASEMSSEQKRWAKVRLLPWYFAIVGEITMHGMYFSTLVRSDEHIKRLQRFMELSPSEFVHLCNLTGGRT